MPLSVSLVVCLLMLFIAEQKISSNQSRLKPEVFVVQSCPKTCENKNRQGTFCIAVCVPGCHCKHGFVLNDNQCVSPEQCTQPIVPQIDPRIPNHQKTREY
ncbi:hypothetical protein B4U80_06744 [Leptotrombidium deliense]|uniref:TIL domain-containing protein n=1 Tax=Leptotrombidium deliense TaxID=299467 RepID=A0A443S1I6_9ACAR|nr:hypothetical protein B4U80_06744 [Leptotrombidium deliense]